MLRICFTGGPAGGKTSCLHFAKQYFENQNLKFFNIPEVPTTLFQTGIDLPHDDVMYREFQKNLFKIQILMEDTVYSAMPPKAVCVCDRGMLDFKGNLLFSFLDDQILAYTKPHDWTNILEEIGMSTDDLLNRYDAVVYFETCALRDPGLYVLNDARLKATPTPQDAIEQDYRTKMAWAQHPNFFTLAATFDFHDKVRTLTSILDSIQNRPTLFERPIYAVAQPKPLLKWKKFHPLAKEPKFMSCEAAGMDLQSVEEIVVPAHGKALVSTGIGFVFPEGCYGRIAPRSGISLNHFIDVGAGVLDRDFCGEVKVLLYNFSDQDFAVEIGDRIAQMICERIWRPEIHETCDLMNTIRGDGCFGSTGRD